MRHPNNAVNDGRGVALALGYPTDDDSPSEPSLRGLSYPPAGALLLSTPATGTGARSVSGSSGVSALSGMVSTASEAEPSSAGSGSGGGGGGGGTDDPYAAYLAATAGDVFASTPRAPPCTSPPTPADGPGDPAPIAFDELLWLRTDQALFDCPEFKPYFVRYAADQAQFFHDYALAHRKMSELGAKFDPPEGIVID
jgi:hypothetical protein